MTDAREILYRLNACREAHKWIGDRTPYQAWRSCERGDWLLWIAADLGIDRKLLVLAACDCAETALKCVPDGEKRPRKAINMARLWCDGKATAGEVRAAARAAYGAYADADAYTDADAAACAADADAYAARAESRQHHATLVRKRIPWRVVKAALKTWELAEHYGEGCKKYASRNWGESI